MEPCTSSFSKEVNTDIQIKEEPLNEIEYCQQEAEHLWNPVGLSIKQEKGNLYTSENSLESMNGTYFSSFPGVVSDSEVHTSETERPPNTTKRNSRNSKRNLSTYKIPLSKAERRARETYEQRQERLRKDRERKAKQRAAKKMTAEIYLQYLQKERERTAKNRSKQTTQQQQERLRRERQNKRMKRLELKIQTQKVETITNIDLLVENGKYKCGMCGFAHESEIAFKEHYLYHFRRKNYSCNSCGENFFYKLDLMEHTFVHADAART